MHLPRKLLTFALSLVSVLALGCDAAGPDGQFRGAFLDGTVQIVAADGGDDDGSILWEIVELESAAAGGGGDDGSILWEIVELESAAAGGGGDDGSILWEIVELESAAASGGGDDGSILWEIVEVNGARTVCEIQNGQLTDSREHILLAQQAGKPHLIVDDEGNDVFKVKGDSLVDPRTGAPIVRATVDLLAAGEVHVLGTAALVAGLCRE